jgi:hypothetical protein
MKRGSDIKHPWADIAIFFVFGLVVFIWKVPISARELAPSALYWAMGSVFLAWAANADSWQGLAIRRWDRIVTRYFPYVYQEGPADRQGPYHPKQTGILRESLV